MEPKRNYSIKWTQPYNMNQQVTIIELDVLRDMVIEQMLDAKDFKEADELIARIKAL